MFSLGISGALKKLFRKFSDFKRERNGTKISTTEHFSQLARIFPSAPSAAPHTPVVLEDREREREREREVFAVVGVIEFDGFGAFLEEN
jgi:hypothetical protein